MIKRVAMSFLINYFIYTALFSFTFKTELFFNFFFAINYPVKNAAKSLARDILLTAQKVNQFSHAPQVKLCCVCF